MENFTLSPEQVNNFLADGFLVIPNLLDTEKTELLLAVAIADPMMKENVCNVSDRKGQTSQRHSGIIQVRIFGGWLAAQIVS